MFSVCYTNTHREGIKYFALSLTKSKMIKTFLLFSLFVFEKVKKATKNLRTPGNPGTMPIHFLFFLYLLLIKCERFSYWKVEHIIRLLFLLIDISPAMLRRITSSRIKINDNFSPNLHNCTKNPNRDEKKKKKNQFIRPVG